MGTPAFRTHFVVDTYQNNMPAASFDVPAGWQASSALKWVFQDAVIDPAMDYTYPMNCWAHAEDPATGDAFQRLPNMCFVFVPQAMMTGAGLFQGLMSNATCGVGSSGNGSFSKWFANSGAGDTLNKWLGAGTGDALTKMFGIDTDAQNPSAQAPSNALAGSRVRMFGATMAPPVTATEAITRYLLPAYRPDVQNLRVVSHFAPPNNAPKNTGTQPVGVRIEYTLNGKAFEEEITTTYFCNEAASAGWVQQNWGLIDTLAVRAVHGTLDAKRAMFDQVRNSVKINPQWTGSYIAITQQLGQGFAAQMELGRQQIEAAGQLSKQISANNDAMLGNMQAQRAEANAAWDNQRQQQRQQANEQYNSHDAFSDYIRGTNTYEDPYWGRSQHSNDREYVWTDGQGRYQGSNDASFDPNIGSSQTWQRMRRVG